MIEMPKVKIPPREKLEVSIYDESHALVQIITSKFREIRDDKVWRTFKLYRVNSDLTIECIEKNNDEPIFEKELYATKKE